MYELSWKWVVNCFFGVIVYILFNLFCMIQSFQNYLWVAFFRYHQVKHQLELWNCELIFMLVCLLFVGSSNALLILCFFVFIVWILEDLVAYVFLIALVSCEHSHGSAVFVFCSKLWRFEFGFLMLISWFCMQFGLLLLF